MIVPFDQYQRYKTISDILVQIKEHRGLGNLKILEIGANEHKNLEKFLTNDEIFYSDIELPLELQSDPNCFVADATNLISIKDNEYDFVLACDVFEHIPISKRKNFITELNRVAKYSVIICFPFYAKHIIETETRVNEYFKSFSGEDYRWLQEHSENGLPDLLKLNNLLEELNIYYTEFEHGDIKTWELMMKNHLFTCFAQDLIDYRQELDRYYNESIYPSDISNKNYRAFYIMTKDKENKDIINLPLKIMSINRMRESTLDKQLINLSQDLKDINNLKLRLKFNEEAGKLASIDSYIESKLVDNAFSIFFDYGKGYSEKDRYTIKDISVISKEGDKIYVKIPSNVIKFRLDPLEGKKCILYNLSIISNGISISNFSTNGIYTEGIYIFDTTDAWIEINNQNKDSIYEISTNILLINNNILSLALSEMKNKYIRENNVFIKEINNLVIEKNKLSLDIKEYLYEIRKLKSINEQLEFKNNDFKLEIARLNNKVNKLEDEINRLNFEIQLLKEKENELKEKESEYAQKNNELKEKYARLEDDLFKERNDNLILYNHSKTFEQMYNNISKSTFWKLTKPGRSCVDLTKKIVKSNRVLYKAARGVKCCRENGIGYTIKLSFSKVKKYRTRENVLIKDEANKISDNQLPLIEEKIKFSILVPIYNPDCGHLKMFIDSVMMQNYENWELYLADGSNLNTDSIQKVCEEYAKKDVRVNYIKLEKNLGISENTNACANLATGDYFVLSDQDDLLHPHALYYNAIAIGETDADVLYSDEDHVTEEGKHINVLYKPNWSIDLLYNQMYICHLLVFKKELFEKVKGFRKEFDGSQDYDLMLRFAEITDKICHIPKVLYSWRETETSTALNADAKPYAHYAGKNALDSHLKNKYGNHAYAEFTNHNFVYEARFDLLKEDKKISIIIPMKDKHTLTEECIQSIIKKSTYKNFEIIVVNNNSAEKATLEWFEFIPKLDNRIRVIDANFEFNWSKINNFASLYATGDIFVFLNNDTLVITPDWMERLGELTLREDVGVVGPLLLYEDNTIQHAGVVVGIGGWAEHIYKGMESVHYGTPFISPMVNRNVLAVTGACMCIAKDKFEKLGGFDEEFIICGSDVELGIRAYEMGYNNVYNAHVQLYHLESKSRDSFIPEIDFKKSYECYTSYREDGDPYYNGNLDINSTQPKESEIGMDITRIKKFLKNNRFTATAYKKVWDTIVGSEINYDIPEVCDINYRKAEISSNKLRINILVPSIKKEHVFGGISTALTFFHKFVKVLNCDSRIIITDSGYEADNSIDLDGYTICSPDLDSENNKQIVPFGDRYNKSIPIRTRDIFIATGWWTAYTISEVIKWQNNTFQLENPLIYFIQDYEPGFYPWSSRYLMADSTYKLNIPTIAIFNSKLLKEHFNKNDYVFSKEYYFDPVLNENLLKYLNENKERYQRKKQILIYGRPSVQRNAFELIVASLNKWSLEFKNAGEWEIISLGESFPEIKLNNNVVLKSYGKVSLEKYAQIMLEAKIGISLMVSPHPSYPPLEMSTFGIKTITNCYAHKDLSEFNENIISLDECSKSSIANKLIEICSNEFENSPIMSDSYCNNSNLLDVICNELKVDLNSLNLIE